MCVCVLVLGWCTPPPLTSHPVPFRPNSLLPSSRPFSLVDPTDDLVDLLFGLSCGVCVRGLFAYKILVSVVVGVVVACLAAVLTSFRRKRLALPLLGLMNPSSPEVPSSLRRLLRLFSYCLLVPLACAWPVGIVIDIFMVTCLHQMQHLRSHSPAVCTRMVTFVDMNTVLRSV